MDVVEIDAASNNGGVDNIRDLRDETAYTPSACKYKVYIIDEVHMLSTAAFNALLKTLEEPPAHVIFILATTEIHKVPATILSRCQRYDFTRIGPEDIARRVEYIAGEEKLELTPDGAELIARLADGALRDALSILDTCAGVTAKIDADVVRRMAGVTDRSYLFRISDALEAQDGAAALAQLAQLRQQSVDVKRLTEELIAHYRALMLAALPGGQALLSGVSPEEEALYLEKRPSAGTAGGHPCHPHAGQRLGAHDPRQRSADRAGIGPVQPVGAASADAGGTRTGRAGLPVRRLSLQSCSRLLRHRRRSHLQVLRPGLLPTAEPDTGAAPGSCSGAVGGACCIRTADCRAAGTGRNISCSGGGNHCRLPGGSAGAADSSFAVGGTTRIGGAARCPGIGSATVCPGRCRKNGRPCTRQVP